MTTNIFSYRKYWANRFGIAPFLPMSRSEMNTLGWDSCDVIIITGDAYVDHPSFGMAIIGRLLESQGFRVGIISQPDWHSPKAFKVLGKPNLFFGVTSGNMDSMVNKYTANRKIRSNDAYTTNNMPNKRPDRAVIVYSQRCREAFADTTIIIGGVEASLRRVAHYDYWSDKIRRSILLDSKADILVYGNAERAITAITHRLSKGEQIDTITNLRGTAIIVKKIPKFFTEIDATGLDVKKSDPKNFENEIVRLPSFQQIKSDPLLYAHAIRQIYLESNPNNARAIVQKYGDRDLLINRPQIPLTTKELDKIYELQYARCPHPYYNGKKIPAYEMIKFSITIMRGCFGGCAFCSITAHEGRIIQSRSESSILNEIKKIRNTLGFTGIISDLGGATANMYKLNCKKPLCQAACRRFSCLYPKICPNLNDNHDALIKLYRKAKIIPGIKKVLIASGIRYDLAIRSSKYVKELVSYHVGGYLKIAPEHISIAPLSKMMKPDISSYKHFKQLFDQASSAMLKKQYIIPYFIAAHPGTTNEDMAELAMWLKTNHFRLTKVQSFLPTPMTLSTTMYHSCENPLKPLKQNAEKIFVAKKDKIRNLQKAFLMYYEPRNWPIIRQALKSMGRYDLIGKGKKCLVPSFTTYKQKNKD